MRIAVKVAIFVTAPAQEPSLMQLPVSLTEFHADN